MFGWLQQLAQSAARRQKSASVSDQFIIAAPQQPPADKLILGLDLGEVKDFTALAIWHGETGMRELTADMLYV